MKSVSRIMMCFGVFLIVAGLLGFLSNPEKAKTALMSGGLFGGISFVLGMLAARGWRKARPVSIGLTLFLSIVFVWRASVSWMAYFGGQADKLTAAILISTMLAGSVAVALLLLFRKSKPVSSLPTTADSSA
jgi:hypothetical protein